MKIEMTCRCGAKASWEDDRLGGNAVVRRCAEEWRSAHEKCPPTPAVVYVTSPPPGPAPFVNPELWKPYIGDPPYPTGPTCLVGKGNDEGQTKAAMEILAGAGL